MHLQSREYLVSFPRAYYCCMSIGRCSTPALSSVKTTSQVDHGTESPRWRSPNTGTGASHKLNNFFKPLRRINGQRGYRRYSRTLDSPTNDTLPTSNSFATSNPQPKNNPNSAAEVINTPITPLQTAHSHPHRTNILPAPHPRYSDRVARTCKAATAAPANHPSRKSLQFASITSITEEDTLPLHPAPVPTRMLPSSQLSAQIHIP